jgi:hypothetical protein
MPPEALLYPEFLGLWLNELTQDSLVPNWLSAAMAFAGENPIIWFPVPLLFPPSRECLKKK